MRIVELCVLWVNRASEIAVINAYISLVVLISAAVFFRYALNNSLVWAEEIARYLFIWITFLGAGLGVGKNVHVGVDAVTIKLSVNLQWRVKLFVNIGVIAFLGVLIIYGAKFTIFGMAAKSMVSEIPMGYVYLAAPVGGAVMFSNVMIEILHLLRGRSKQGGN